VSLRPAGVCLGALIALIAIVGTWGADASIALLWRLPAGVLLAGLAYESWVVGRARVALGIEAPERWFLGRSGAATFLFRHALKRRILIEWVPSAPSGVVFEGAVRAASIPAGAAASAQFIGTPRRLGLQQWSAMRIRVAGPLGLAWWPRQLAAHASIRVQPQLLQPQFRGAGGGTSGARSGQSAGAGAEVLQLRAYRPGDPPRVIDWKATGRARQLISRDFSEDQHLEILILIDAGRASGLRSGELDRFGHYVNVAARLAQYAVAQDDLVGVIVFADRPLLECAPGRGAAAVGRIRKLLGAARVESSESDPLQAAIRVRSLARRRSLVVLLTDLDDAAVAGQLAGAARLLLPKHLPFIAGLSSAHAESMAKAAAGRWLDPYRALAAQEYCASLERKVQTLRALGAPALVAKPERLESAVFQAYTQFRRQRRV
jgi:uncharacterized protein (DUF58 family)